MDVGFVLEDICNYIVSGLILLVLVQKCGS